ncbi:hypothetical protein NQD34_002978 [Periophthalmus magnuspinnatus]|nr:hypothetical protein NQD34_002978 [Periophthalmus magnuspinnatus]
MCHDACFSCPPVLSPPPLPVCLELGGVPESSRVHLERISAITFTCCRVYEGSAEDTRSQTVRVFNMNAPAYFCILLPVSLFAYWIFHLLPDSCPRSLLLLPLRSCSSIVYPLPCLLPCLGLRCASRLLLWLPLSGLPQLSFSWSSPYSQYNNKHNNKLGLIGGELKCFMDNNLDRRSTGLGNPKTPQA